MEKVSMSHEDYLEAIVMLGGTSTLPVRSVDIAAKLGVSKASVSKAVASLKASGNAQSAVFMVILLLLKRGMSMVRLFWSVIP